eukprot:4672123-Prymnesium_polylepis.1
MRRFLGSNTRLRPASGASVLPVNPRQLVEARILSLMRSGLSMKLAEGCGARRGALGQRGGVLT